MPSLSRIAAKSALRQKLTKKQALAICGSLSKPGKMPGHGYSLPATQCRVGSLLRLIPGSVCAHCYALHGRYVFPVVGRAMRKRLESISDPRWTDAIASLIARSGEKHFRWHDSGDIQGIEHLEKIAEVAQRLPSVKFWLPTREYYTVEAYRRAGGRIPPNLCIRYSAHKVDGPPPLRYGLPVATVSSKSRRPPRGAFRCPAPRHGNRCGPCRACWDRKVRIVDFPLKWPASVRRSRCCFPRRF